MRQHLIKRIHCVTEGCDAYRERNNERCRKHSIDYYNSYWTGYRIYNDGRKQILNLDALDTVGYNQ